MVNEFFVKEVKVFEERWVKNKDLFENYGERDVVSKVLFGSCCILFLKK